MRLLRLFFLTPTVILMFGISGVLQGSSLRVFDVRGYPTGQRPIGMDLQVSFDGAFYAALVAVANSGEDSVSLFDLRKDLQTGRWNLAPKSIVKSVPAPYGVAFCTHTISGGGTSDSILLATSPSKNSLVVIDVVQARVLSVIEVGPQPYSVICLGNKKAALVSNFGDSTLSVVDLNSFTVVTRIQGAPGSKGWNGIGTSGSYILVAGTEANLITVLDTDFHVYTWIPFPRPTAFIGGSVTGGGGITKRVVSYYVYLASASESSLTRYEVWPSFGPTGKIDNVPASQDFAGTDSYFAFTTKDGELYLRGNDPTSLVRDVSGAASVKTFYTGDGGPQQILVTSPETNTLFLVQERVIEVSVPQAFQVSNGASFLAPSSPGSLASTFLSTGSSQNFSASFLPLPKTLGGITLRIGGSLNYDVPNLRWNYSPVGSIEAPLLSVGPNQINFQIPPGVTVGDTVPAQVQRPDGTTLITTLQIAAVQPGVFSVSMNGRGPGAVLNQDNSQNWITSPARRGSVIQIFATGAGETDPPMLPGEPAPSGGNPLVLTRVQPTVTIGGQPARVTFSGMAPGYVGLWQINAEVPQTVNPGPAVSLVVTAGSISSNTVTIAVE